MESTVLLVASTVGLVFLCSMLFLALFEPGLPYTITRAPARLAAPGFLRMLGALVDAGTPEVNLAACDAALAERLLEDFARDLEECSPVTYRDWLRRSLLERWRGRLGTLLERQQ